MIFHQRKLYFREVAFLHFNRIGNSFIDKPFQANPLEDKRLIRFLSENQLPVPPVSMRQKEDQAIGWTQVGPKCGGGAYAPRRILYKITDNRSRVKSWQTG